MIDRINQVRFGSKFKTGNTIDSIIKREKFWALAKQGITPNSDLPVDLSSFERQRRKREQKANDKKPFFFVKKANTLNMFANPKPFM